MTAAFTFATDPTKGKYFASFTNSVGTAVFAPDFLFGVYLFHKSNQTTTHYTSNTGWTIVETTTGLVTTVRATFIADPAVVLTLTYTREDEAVAIRLVSCTGSITHAVSAVTRITLLIAPSTIGATADTFALAHTYASGFTLPKAAITGTGFAAGPDNMQFTSYFDTTTNHQRHLYLWTDDEETQPKLWGCLGNGAQNGWSFIDFADRRFQVGNLLARTYALRVELFTGQAIDGQYGAAEAALRYRTWAADPARPWRSRGLWRDAAEVSPFVKSMDFHVSLTGQRFISRWTSDLDKWRSVAGFEYPFFTIYSWKNPGDFAEVFDPEPTHSGPIAVEVKDFIIDMQSNGWRVMPFMHNHLFDNRASSGWLYDDWASSQGLPGDLSPLMLMNPQGAVREEVLTDSSVPVYGAGANSSLDFAHADVATFALDVTERLLTALETGVPGAFYLDALATSFPATPAFDPVGAGPFSFQDDPAQPDWTFAAYSAGRETFFTVTRDRLRAEFGADAFVMTEWPSEWSMPFVDMVFAHENHEYIGAPAGLLQIVHGDVTRVSSFAIDILIVNHVGVALTNIVQATYGWMRSGIWAMNDGLDIVANTVFGSGALEATGFYYYIFFAMRLKAMYPLCRPYMQGSLYRPLITDWRTRLYGACDKTVLKWKNLISTDSFFFAETWKHPDTGDLGIVVAFVYTAADQILPAHVGLVPILPAETRTLTIDAERDELGEGYHTVYRTTDNGTRTVLGNFRDSITLTVTFAPGTVTLLEVFTRPYAAAPSTVQLPLWPDDTPTEITLPT